MKRISVGPPRQNVRLRRQHRRALRTATIGALAIIGFLYFIRSLGPHRTSSPAKSGLASGQGQDGLASDSGGQTGLAAQVIEEFSDPPSIHLVVASVASSNISWTSKVPLQNLKVIRYVADGPSATYHPPMNKGNEALIYHTYFHDFYDSLPDISILVHADETSWHMDFILSNLTFALSQLDLYEVKKRGYANLRVDWRGACPDWIDTRATKENRKKREELFMREAFLANFGPAATSPGGSAASVDVPRYLAQPCCNQFAVTRGTVRSVPRERFSHFMHWLETTELDDSISGRTWEHFFQFLFAGRAVDCPIPWKAYCVMYHICFDGPPGYEKWVAAEKKRGFLLEDLSPGFTKKIWQWLWGITKESLIKKVEIMDERLEALRAKAMETGRNEQARRGWTADIYAESFPGYDFSGRSRGV